MKDETLLTTKEVAALLRTSAAQIYNLIHQGAEGTKIPPSIQIGRRRLWLNTEVMNFLKCQTNTQDEKTSLVKVRPLTPRINKI
jgi:excisionase family DNA binding protein